MGLDEDDHDCGGRMLAAFDEDTGRNEMLHEVHLDGAMALALARGNLLAAEFHGEEAISRGVAAVAKALVSEEGAEFRRCTCRCERFVSVHGAGYTHTYEAEVVVPVELTSRLNL